MSQLPLEVRRLDPAEAGLFRELRLEGLQREPDAFAATFENEAAQSLTFFADRLTTSAVFGAFRGDHLLGIAGFHLQQGTKHAHKGTLWGMYVRAAARRAGVGRLLVEAVIEHAHAQVEILQLSVIGENQAARRLYTRLGFVEYGIEKRAAKYQGRYHDDVLMAKMLNVPASGDDCR